MMRVKPAFWGTFSWFVTGLVLGCASGCASEGKDSSGPASSASLGPDGQPLVPGAVRGEPSDGEPARPSSAGSPDSTNPGAPNGDDAEPGEPAGPGSAGPPDDPSAVDPDSPGAATDPSSQLEPATPENAGQEFTRLTRLEYQATVRAALGVDVDATELPVDGRVGVFTSNVGVTPDPVHPYLLAAEELAARVVPEVLPACDDDATECVREVYQEPIARLYRRELTQAELAALAAMVDGLREPGASAEEATRALLGSALISPDFLFRSSPSNGEGASTRRLVERLSYALWDAPPDEQLRALVGLPDGELEAALSTEVDRLGKDPRATRVLARFLAQWLDVDTDKRRDDDASFEESPSFREHLAFVENAIESELPIRELVRSQSGFVHRENVADYPELDDVSSDEELANVEWPDDSIRRGILGQDLFAASTRHPDESRRVIFRGLLIRRSFMCDDIPAPSADLIALAGEVGDRTEDGRCATCHQLLDPIGRAFAGLDPDYEGESLAAEVLGTSELAGSYEDLPALLDAIADSRRFAECFSRHFLSFFLERPTSLVDDAWVNRLADSVEANATLLGLTEQVMVELALQAPATVPWCEGE